MDSGLRSLNWHRSALRVMAGILAAAMLLASCGGGDDEEATGGSGGGPAGFAEMDEVTLKVATLYGPDQWQSTPIKAYADAVTKRSGGKIKFDFFYGPALLAPDEIADGLKNGIADMAYFVPVYTPAKFPLDNWVSQLGFVPDSSPVAGTLQAAAATMDWGFNTPEYLDSFESQGLKPLVPRLQIVHEYKLLCKNPVKTLQDARGKRVRIGGPAWAAEAKNLGMSGVTIAGEEIFPAFQRGIIDCFMGGLEDMAGLKLIEVGKNITTTQLTGFTSYGMIMGLDKWNDLPLIAQQALWDEIPTYLKALYSNAFEENKSLVQTGEKAGVKFFEPGEEITQKVEQYHEQLLNNAPGGAPEGTDGQALADSYIETHDKWLKIVKDDLGFPADAQNWPDQLQEDPEASYDLQPWADAVKKNILDPQRPK